MFKIKNEPEDLLWCDEAKESLHWNLIPCDASMTMSDILEWKVKILIGRWICAQLIGDYRNAFILAAPDSSDLSTCHIRFLQGIT